MGKSSSHSEGEAKNENLAKKALKRGAEFREAQKLKAEQKLDHYLRVNIQLGVEHLTKVRLANPSATPLEVWRTMATKLADEMVSAADEVARSIALQEFVLGSIALNEVNLNAGEKRKLVAFLVRKMNGMNLKKNAKFAANGLVIAAEIAIEVIPFAKNVKWIKNFKKVKPATVEKVVKGVAQAGMIGANKLINHKNNNRVADSVVPKVKELLGELPKDWGQSSNVQ